MSGHYNWLHFARDTFQNTHVTMVPALVYVAMAYVDHLNIYHMLYLGVFLAAVKLVLLHNTFTITAVRTDRTLRLVMLPVLSWLIFSVSQMSVFEHGFQSIKTGINELGLALGIWALVRFRGRWTAVAVMAVGGILASFSFACGLILWLLFPAGMAATGFRKKRHYFAMIGAAAVAAAPYIDLLYGHPVQARQTAVASLFNPVFLINYLGRPFTNGSGLHYERMPVSEVAGIVGLLLLAAGIWIIWRDRRVAALEQATPGLILVSFSVLAGWLIALYRTQIAPWYISFAMDFWIGLVGIAYVVWVRHSRPVCAVAGQRGGDEGMGGVSDHSPPRRGEHRARAEKTDFLHSHQGVAAKSWSLGVVGIIVALYIPANRTRSDKSFFLRTRAPVSASCLRQYPTAPTYCEQTLVPWEVGFSGYLAHLGRPLAEHSLSVFAPHQQWTLQGDYILDSVRLHEAAGSPEVYWSPDLSGSKSDFTDYNHLNLVLGPPNYISWSVSLPKDLENAVFHSAVGALKARAGSPADATVSLSLHIEEAGAQTREAFSWPLSGGERSWHSFSFPLTEYAGKSITLKLMAAGESSGALGVFKYPYIDVSVKTSGDQAAFLDGLRPSNTDLSAACPAPGPLDYHMDLSDVTKWKTEGLIPEGPADRAARAWLVSEANPTLEYTAAMDVDLSGYGQFFIRMAASAQIDHRAVRIYYKTDPAQEFNEGMALVIPLLADGDLHTYTYDLKLTGIRRSRLAGIKIVPIRPPSVGPTNRVEIADLGLILRTGQDASPATSVAGTSGAR